MPPRDQLVAQPVDVPFDVLKAARRIRDGGFEHPERAVRGRRGDGECLGDVGIRAMALDDRDRGIASGNVVGEAEGCGQVGRRPLRSSQGTAFCQ